MKLRRVLPLVLALALCPGIAHAGPVVGFIGGIVGSISSALAAGGIAAFAIRTVAALALSALAKALAPKPRAPGIKTSVTAGGVTPESVIIGKYATAGHLAAPPMSHGKDGKTPNAYLNLVIELGGVPGAALAGLILDGERVDITDTVHEDYGNELGGKYAGRAWVRYHDGTQTAADAMLLAKYSAAPDHPWSATMIGTGLCYAVLTFRFDREVFQGIPTARFELQGIPLYDPRKDSTAGGVGAQRWADVATWETSDNPAVMVYNILRGVEIPGTGSYWGGGATAEEMPFDTWAAAMNICDESVALSAGGSEPRYRAGLEVTVDQHPADVIDELIKACAGDICDMGDAWKVRAGGPGLPVLFITDDDIIITSPQDFAPFPGLADTHNGVTASYPEPAALWENKDAPPRYNATWEAADDGRRLVADLQLPSVPYGMQVQRLMRAWAEDARRFRQHGITLPPDASLLEPLDTIGWTSAANGYVAKIFDVDQQVDDQRSILQHVQLREVDPDDYDWTTGDELPSPPVTPPVLTPPAAQAVTGWAVTGTSIKDANSIARRPALQLSWDADGQDDVRGVRWEVRIAATAETVAVGSTQATDAGGVYLSDGILPDATYQARGRWVANRATAWTPWVNATTPDTRLGAADISTAVTDAITAANTAANNAFDHADDVQATLQANVDALTSDVIAAYGPLTVSPPLASQISSIGSDLASQTITVADISRNLELAVPRDVRVDDQIATISRRLASLTTLWSATQSRMSDAGIYVDPDAGTVKIEAVNRIDSRVGEVSVTLDAVQAELSLKASQSWVNSQISEAVLDPSQIPVIGDLQAQVNQVSVDLDAAEASITSKADTTTVNGLDVRLTTAESDIDSLDGQMAQRVTTTQFDGLDQRVTTAETTLGALDTAEIGFAVEQSRASITDQDAAALNTIADVLQGHKDRATTQADVAYARTEMTAKVDDTNTALATLKTTLGAAIGANEALISQEAQTRADADSTMAQDISSLQTDTSDNSAKITALNTVSAASDSPTARALHQVQLDVQGATDQGVANSTAVQNLTTRVSSAEGDISTQGQDISTLESTIDDPQTGLAKAHAKIASEATTRANADSALSQNVSALQTRMTDTETGTSANATAISGLQTRTTTAEGNITSQGQSISNLESTVNDPQSGVAAHGSAISGLDTRVTDNEGDITSLSSSLTQLQSTVTDPQTGLAQTRSDLSSLAATQASDKQALASDITTLSAQVNDPNTGLPAANASITTQAAAIADIEGNAAASYVIRANDQDVLEIVAASDPVNGPVTTLALDADYVRITGLTQIDNAVLGQLAASQAFIGNLTVDTLQIKKQAVTVPVQAFAHPYSNPVQVNSETPVELARLVINRAAGFQTNIFASFDGDAYGNATAAMTIQRSADAGSNWDTVRWFNGGISIGGREFGRTFASIDANRDGGTTIYRLTGAKAPASVTGGYDADIRFYRCYISAVQFKR